MPATMAGAPVATETASGSLSIPVLVGAAALIGIGMIGMTYWLITFHWVLLLSLLPLIGGGLLLFSRATGPDHA